MGGAPKPPPLPGQTPIPVPPFGGLNPPARPVQPATSMKGGTLAGIPALSELFGRAQGGPLLFGPSQSFPQPPVTGGGTPSLVRPPGLFPTRPLVPGLPGLFPVPTPGEETPPGVSPQSPFQQMLAQLLAGRERPNERF